MFRILLITYMILLTNCLPPSVDAPHSDSIQHSLDFEDCDPCDLILNFASSNYQNRDWIFFFPGKLLFHH